MHKLIDWLCRQCECAVRSRTHSYNRTHNINLKLRNNMYCHSSWSIIILIYGTYFPSLSMFVTQSTPHSYDLKLFFSTTQIRRPARAHTHTHIHMVNWKTFAQQWTVAQKLIQNPLIIVKTHTFSFEIDWLYH